MLGDASRLDRPPIAHQPLVNPAVSNIPGSREPLARQMSTFQLASTQGSSVGFAIRATRSSR